MHHGKEKSDAAKGTKRRLKPPLPAAHFRVLIDREEIGMLSVSPLHCLIEGKADPELRQSVILRRAATQDRRLFDWHRAAVQSGERVRELLIVQLDSADGTEMNVWELQRATPVRWTGPRFDALSNEIAIEELEVRYESIAWRKNL